MSAHRRKYYVIAIMEPKLESEVFEYLSLKTVDKDIRELFVDFVKDTIESIIEDEGYISCKLIERREDVMEYLCTGVDEGGGRFKEHIVARLRRSDIPECIFQIMVKYEKILDRYKDEIVGSVIRYYDYEIKKEGIVRRDLKKKYGARFFVIEGRARRKQSKEE